MKEINAPFPDVEVACPNCKIDLYAAGYEFEPGYITAMARSTVYCEACDEEFLVLVGGDL